MTIKLLIVDDEIQIRTGLQQEIDWAEVGIHTTFVAENGIAALQCYTKFEPDIVITDIRMPKMDGLELIESIKRLSSTCKFIVLSGYSDFDYAKKALQYGVVDYKLKPVNIEDLVDVVKDVTQTIKNEERDRSLFQHYVLNEVSRQIIEDRLTVSSFHKIASYYDNWQEADRIRVCLFEIKNLNEHEFYYDMLQREVTQIPGFIYTLCPGRIMIVLNTKNRAFQIKDWWLNIIPRINIEAGEITMGISDESEFLQAHILYLQAQGALNGSLLNDNESEYYYYESQSDHTDVDSLIAHHRENIEKCLQEETCGHLEEYIKQLFNRYYYENHNGISQASLLSDSLLEIAETEVRKKYGVYISHNPGAINETQSFDQLKTIKDLETFTLLHMKIMYDQILLSKSLTNSKSVAKIISYIYEKFNRDLTVKHVAHHFEQSPNYFSHKFKKEIGISFTSFLNQVRIMIAARLIEFASHVPLYNISEAIGFKDYNYFAKVFKSYKDVSPSEFQEEFL